MLKTLALTTALSLTFAASTALACGDEAKSTVTAQASTLPATVSVNGLAKRMKSKKKTPVVLDVNGKETRETFGTIPGAVLLTSYAEYKLTELPKDKKSDLVFYCSNTKCGASKTAAKRALEAGYQSVSVLPAGIMGWKDAGQKVTAVKGAS